MLGPDFCEEAQNILEEERQRLFTCFKCGRFALSDSFTVLDWETAECEERFIYVCHRCLAAYG